MTIKIGRHLEQALKASRRDEFERRVASRIQDLCGVSYEQAHAFAIESTEDALRDGLSSESEILFVTMLRVGSAMRY